MPLDGGLRCRAARTFLPLQDAIESAVILAYSLLSGRIAFGSGLPKADDKQYTFTDDNVLAHASHSSFNPCWQSLKGQEEWSRWKKPISLEVPAACGDHPFKVTQSWCTC